MSLLGAETLTVTPYTVSIVDHVPTPAAGTPYTVTGSVLPIGERALQMLPEGARSSARFELYVEGTDPIPNTAEAGKAADRVSWGGRSYVVTGVQDYTQHTTGLPHRRYVMLEVGSDE